TRAPHQANARRRDHLAASAIANAQARARPNCARASMRAPPCPSAARDCRRLEIQASTVGADPATGGGVGHGIANDPRQALAPGHPEPPADRAGSPEALANDERAVRREATTKRL